MNLLSLGAKMPRNWGAPRSLFNYSTGQHDSGGMIWYGPNQVTPKDRKALQERFGDGVKIDERSTVGRRNPSWTTFSRQHKKDPQYNQRVVLGFKF